MYTARLANYVPEYHLPLYVEFVERNTHPEKMFHIHEFFELVLILNGRAEHLIQRSLVPIRKGDILIIPPRYCHAYSATSEFELVNIVYDHKQLFLPMLDSFQLPLFHLLFPLESSYAKKSFPIGAVMNLEDSKLEQAADLIRQLQRELTTAQPGSQFFSLTLFMNLLMLLGRNCTAELPFHHSPDILIGAAVQFIRENFGKNLSVEELARSSHMSKRNFFRHFKATTGCSPQLFLRQVRIQKALELLEQSNKDIYEVAMECGFYDSSHFSRVFHREKGCTPRHYREQKRKMA